MRPAVHPLLPAILLASLITVPAMGAGQPLVPVFPASAPGLVWVEGEDAVSTNMATEATLNYGCSGSRALQLSRPSRFEGGAAYYAEYAVQVGTEGPYELWYGGTPPGPRDEFSPSFASPLSVSVDGGPARELWREDVNVVEAYTPAYYWVRCISLRLTQGAHVIRIEVSQKRRLDGKFFFYLDALFLAAPDLLATVSKGGEGARAGLPARFPQKPSDRAIDNPFLGFEEYQSRIQATPSRLNLYLELAAEYSLASDYLNALKVLSRAAVVAPKDPDVRILIAKNRIWRGDSKEGLDAYGVYLELRPDDLGAYAEAGKVAAWIGRYADSEYFYAKGLAAFPADLGLTVNLGFTQLWAGRVADAEKSFALALKQALASPEGVESLAAVYRENGFPDRAIATYEKGLAAYPDRVGFYLAEAAILAAQGKDAAAAAVEARIRAAFEASPRLDAELASAKAGRGLKADRMAALEARIAADPGNLGLREELTRVYAWAGRKLEASRQLESLLAARFAASLDAADSRLEGVTLAQFTAAALAEEARLRAEWLAGHRAKVAAASAAAAKALSELARIDKAKVSAAAKDAVAAAAARRAGEEGAGRALADLATALDGLDAEEARLMAALARLPGLDQAVRGLAERDAEDYKAFADMASKLHWSFDPQAAAAELLPSASRGESIAALGRARLLLASRKPDDARAVLAAIKGDALSQGRELASALLAARRDPRSLHALATAGASGLPALAAAASALADLAAMPEPAAQDPALPPADSALEAWTTAASALDAKVAAGLAAAGEAATTAATFQSSCLSLVQLASALEDRFLARAWHDFEAGALDLRSELGSYYDALGLASQATRQYRRVLALDPGNLRAMYSLARAEEKAGDWSEAARLFKAVDSADPTFGGAAALHNAIARLHAPRFDVESLALADMNLFEYRGSAKAYLPLSSALSLQPSAKVDSVRDHAQGLPAYLAFNLGLEAPLSLSAWQGGSLVLRPSLSLVGSSADFAAYGATTVTPGQFLSAVSLYSGAGLALDWSADSWSGTAAYSWEPIASSLNPALVALYAHRLELSGGAYLPLGGLFRYLAPRSALVGNWVPGDLDNLYGSALLELVPALRLSDSPWANLAFPLDLVYEASTHPRTSPYYAGDGALTAKAGLLWQSTFTGKEGRALALVAQATGGIYSERAFSSTAANWLYLSALLRADWFRTGITYSVYVEASATDPFAASPRYWSFAVFGSVSAKQPALVAP
jgi:Tfp pilus assembly protein PilF